MPKTILDEFTNIEELQNVLKSKDETYWIKRGEKMALSLFKEMSDLVPAYKDFLKHHNFNPDKVKDISDFKSIPLIDKENYLRRYPRKALCWGGEFNDKAWVISTTSGTTGLPFFFPRTELQDNYYALTAELYLRENFHIQDHSTLYICAFPMGAWIGGVFTYAAITKVARNGYKLSIITPGINNLEVINCVKNLSDDFDQTIIGAYGPFLKDILDEGTKQGVEWKKYNLKFVLSAESFSEQFRDYIYDVAGQKNVYFDSLNHYGTVDLGTMSHETPISILARRQALKSPLLYKSIFGETYHQPTLTQFLPEMFYFESVGEEIYCSSYSGLPLVRYDLKDRGKVMLLSDVSTKFEHHRKDLLKIAEDEGVASSIWNIPMVYVYERRDFSVSFYALQIYPETIRRALLKSEPQEVITGKFTMLVDFDKNGDQFFEINIESRFEQLPSKKEQEVILRVLTDQLLMENSEYRKIYEIYGDKILPKLTFWPKDDSKYFTTGGKQKWVRK